MRGILLVAVIAMVGCARLDRVQIGSIDQTQGPLTPISVRLSETGFEAAAVAETGRRLTDGQASENLEALRTILAISNMGPRTGNPVYTDAYAERLLEYLRGECASGQVTGVRSIREAKGFGPVTGEIVGVDAYCINK